MKLKVVSLLLWLLLFVPFTHAQTINTTLIQQLLAQIAALRAELAKLQGTTLTCTFTRTLYEGTQGTDVTCLQNYLKAKGYFTGTPTGFYGPLTKAAVYTWQQRVGIVPEPTAIGMFGPRSRVIMMQEMDVPDHTIVIPQKTESKVSESTDLYDGQKEDQEVLPTIKKTPVIITPSLLTTQFETETISSYQIQTDIIKGVSSSENIPGLPIFYEGGSDLDRHAEIVSDPIDPNNHVLSYWIKNAKIPNGAGGKYKGRVQASMGNLALTESYEKFKIYISPDVALYRTIPIQNTWFTIEEMWFGLRWENHPYPFRISLNLAKDKGADTPLYLFAAGIVDGNGEAGESGEWNTIWHSVNKNFEIPVGEWIDIEIGYKQGNENTGRFIVKAKRDTDTSMRTVVDVHNWTYHPDSPAPVSLNAWQPLKLYTSGDLINYIREKGGLTQVYFDDLEIKKTWPVNFE